MRETKKRVHLNTNPSESITTNFVVCFPLKNVFLFDTSFLTSCLYEMQLKFLDIKAYVSWIYFDVTSYFILVDSCGLMRVFALRKRQNNCEVSLKTFPNAFKLEFVSNKIHMKTIFKKMLTFLNYFKSY